MQVRTGWRWFRSIGAVLVVVVALEYGLVPQLVEAWGDLSLLGDVSPFLLVVAVALEVGSLAAYTALTQVLLGPAETLHFGTQWRIDLAGFGLSHVVPGGGASASAIRAGLMVERGVAAASVVSLVAVQTALSVVGLLAVWSLGSLMSLPRTGATATSVLLLLAALAVTAGLYAAGHRPPGGRPSRLVRWVGRAVARVLPRRWWDTVATAVRQGSATLRDARVTRSGATWSVVNWLLDALCLGVCLAAFGAHVPPELVLTAYGLANMVGLLPITPGGIGVIEGVLVPALIAAGAPAGPAVLGVLAWRLLQYWLPIPVAGLCWASLARPAAGPGAGGGTTPDACDQPSLR